MHWFVKKIQVRSSPYSVGKLSALMFVCSLTACGGGDDTAVNGSLTRASTTVVSQADAASNGNGNGKANRSDAVSPPGQARKAVLHDPLVNSTNPATKKYLAMKCARQAKSSPAMNKARYGASTRASLRQAACAAIAAR